MASRNNRATWPLFARASLATGLIAGFGLGALLFAALLDGETAGLWWPAAAQAHGHAQLVGWAGLMALGIGLHFLPRLASAPAPQPGVVRIAFWILVCGLTARVTGQTVLGLVDDGNLPTVARAAWVLGASAELAGVTLLLASLALSLRTVLPLRPDAAIRPVLPMLAIGFAGLLIFLGSSAISAIEAALDASPLIPHQRSTDSALIGLYGFLMPISVAMSIRIFPLYFRTRPAHTRVVRIGLALLATGVVLRLIGPGSSVDTIGRLLVLLSIASFAVGVRVFEPRRALPRRQIRIWQDAPGLHVLAAFLWLVCAGLAQLGGDGRTSLEIHLLGAGFVTLLILGSGVHLIPGFARRQPRAGRYVWATLALANLAVIARAVPALPEIQFPATIERACGAGAGLAGLAALAVFAFNLREALLNPR